MGCCVSTKRGTFSPPKPTKKQHSKPPPLPPPPPKSPPPPLEEEKVKEVLSEETHKPNLQPTKYPHLEPLKQTNSTKLSHIRNSTPKATIQQEETSNLSLQEGSVDDIVSEQEKSEISSSTITNDFSYEEEREWKPPRRVKSTQSSATSKMTRPTNNYGTTRDRVVGKSPTRRAEQSPARRGVTSGSVRVVQSRDQLTGQGMVRKGLRYDPNRNGPTGGRGPAGRRPRSPGTGGRSEIGRSPGRKLKSPGRVRTDPMERTHKVEEIGQGNNVRPSANSDVSSGAHNNNNQYTSNESLENPLVSLECFIFL